MPFNIYGREKPKPPEYEVTRVEEVGMVVEIEVEVPGIATPMCITLDKGFAIDASPERIMKVVDEAIRNVRSPSEIDADTKVKDKLKSIKDFITAEMEIRKTK